MSETDPPVGNSSLEKVGHSPTENGEILDVRSSLLPGPSPGSGRSSPENKTSEAARKKARKERRVEEELKKAGFGVFHVILVLVTGLATAADSVEIFGVSFVLPIADDDLDLSTAHKGYLDASIFIGMLIGGYLWGSLADVFGRKRTLLSAMLLNGVCGLVAAFSPNFYFFLFFRFASGLGVGGSQPIVFSYVSEFFTEKLRGPMIILLASFWQPGIIFTALLAWILLGSSEGVSTSISFYIGTLHFVNWRLFLIICTLPAFVSAFSLVCMTETPAFLFQAGKIGEFERVMRRISRVNSSCACCWFIKPVDDTEPLLSDSQEEDENEASNKSDLEESCLSQDSEQSKHDPEVTFEPSLSIRLRDKGKSFVVNGFSKIKMIFFTTVELFRLHYIRATLLLLIVWFMQSFGYYGLQLWFPEYFKRLLYQECNATSLEFEIPPLPNCSNETNLQFYQDTLYTALASLPGNIAGTLLVNVVGARIQLVVALVLSAMSVFLIWGIPSVHAAIVGVSCVFSAVTVTVFGSLDVVNMNIYDITVRSTAFGLHSGIGRLGAIFGNLMFGHLLDVSRTIPILIVASFLSVGALAAIFLPAVYRPENRPPLVRALHRFKAWLRWRLCRDNKDRQLRHIINF